MKIFSHFFCLMMFMGIFSVGKAQLRGAYVTEDIGFESNLFYFDKGRFVRKLSHCTGTIIGMGTYEEKNGKLILKYEETTFEPEFRVLRQSHEEVGGTVKVRVLDRESREPLQHAIIILEGTNIGCFSDEFGIGVIEWNEAIDITGIAVKRFGYAVEVPINLSKGTDIELDVLLGSTSFFEPGFVEKLKIERKNSRKFNLKLAKGSFSRFVRISDSRYQELMNFE